MVLITDLSTYIRKYLWWAENHFFHYFSFWFFVCLFGFFFHDITSLGKVNYAQARDPIIRAIS